MAEDAEPRVMEWPQGRPCTQCGRPTANRLHQFDGGGRSWAYYAPLYHNADRNAGFCGAECSFEWAKMHVYHNLGNR